MDCYMCRNGSLLPSTSPNTRTPNYTCVACLIGVKSLVSNIDKLERDSGVVVVAGDGGGVNTSTNSISKVLSNALNWVEERKEIDSRMKEVEKELKARLGFLDKLVIGFKDGFQTDIQLKPNNGPSIPAHRALLATRSCIFKNMIESDDLCKAPSEPTDTITLPELNHEELESFLEFLYTGSLPAEKVKKHIFALFMASDKYEISFLHKFCEDWMVGSLDLSNVLDVLELSNVCSSNKTLKDNAMKFVIKHMADIVSTPKYNAFVLKNPHLSIEITKVMSKMMARRGFVRLL